MAQGEPWDEGDSQEQWGQSLATGLPQPLPPATDRTGDKDRDEAPKQAEKDWLVRKRLAEEM